MKLYVFLISIAVTFCNCSNTNNPKIIAKKNYEKKTEIADSCNQGDSLLLIKDRLLLKYANEFKPNSIELDKSFSNNFKQFIETIDTNCLRRQKEYKPFITIILAKLYAYHEKCCNQGYDIDGMKEGGAKLIVNEFERMIGLADERIEFLNSFRVIDYIVNDDMLKQNKTLQKILKKVKYKGRRYG
jgi:hypothetical protein